MTPSTSLSRILKDMAEERLVVKKTRGVYEIPEDPEVALHNARVRHGKFKRDERLRRENNARRTIQGFFYDVLTP